MMKILLMFAFFTLVSLTAQAAEEFDGSRPIDCDALSGHDCLPTEASCKPLKPQAGKALTLHVDVAHMSLKTPYRNSAMQIQSFGFNTSSLTMQGTSLELVWSATIHRKTGRFTAAVTDREGAYVIFGQCKLAAAQPRD
jgi:hypothetical protein